MRTLLLLRGIPASSKSTYAKELIVKNKKYKRVNRDLLREMIDAGQWSQTKEKYIRECETLIAKIYVDAGFCIIVDDTNLSESAYNLWKQFANDNGLHFEEKFFDISLEEAIKRDLARPNSVGEKVIRKFYNDYLAPKPAIYTPPEGKPDAYVFDIDGTLAHGIGITRKPYEWDKVGTDTLDQELRHVLMSLKGYDIMADPEETIKIILLSGRDSVCRPETEQWLQENNIPYDHLYMRPEGDKRKDYEVKEELFNKYIRDNYRVRVIFDDRDQVIKLWRSLGLTCYQVADGDF